MKKLFTLLLLVALAYGAYPYFEMYRLDQALQSNDQATLKEMVDIQSVRGDQKRQLAITTDKAVGYSDNIISQFLREGAQVIGETAVDSSVDMDWFVSRLNDGKPASEPFAPMLERVTHAFFEKPRAFMFRVGEMNASPVQVLMVFGDDYKWKVVALYES